MPCAATGKGICPRSLLDYDSGINQLQSLEYSNNGWHGADDIKLPPRKSWFDSLGKPNLFFLRKHKKSNKESIKLRTDGVSWS